MLMEMKEKKGGSGDPELDELLEGIHWRIRENLNWKRESSVELIKRLRGKMLQDGKRDLYSTGVFDFDSKCRFKFLIS